MVDDKRQNEFFHQAEHGEILMAANLVQLELFRRSEKCDVAHLRQRLRQERFSKVEFFVAADNVLDFPIDATRRCQCRFIRVVMLHSITLPVFLRMNYTRTLGLINMTGASAGRLSMRNSAVAASTSLSIQLLTEPRLTIR